MKMLGPSTLALAAALVLASGAQAASTNDSHSNESRETTVAATESDHGANATGSERGAVSLLPTSLRITWHGVLQTTN